MTSDSGTENATKQEVYFQIYDLSSVWSPVSMGDIWVFTVFKIVANNICSSCGY